MYQGGVTFNEPDEEQSPKASLLTLTRITKGLVEGGEGERREKKKKKKMAEATELLRESIPATEQPEEEIHIEEVTSALSHQ